MKSEKYVCEKCNFRHFKNENALEMHNKSKHYTKSTASKKAIFIGVAIVLVIGLVAVFALRNDSGSSNSQAADGVQKITIGFTNNYDPNTIEVKAGIPVEITLDNSVSGCFRAFTIPQLGISKISRSPSDVVKFTPTQPGIYRFQCGMNMGYGTLIVN